MLQLELRTPVVHWLTLVPFIEYGGIGNSPASIQRWLFSYGLANHIPLGDGTLRIEIAFADQNSEFYFGFNHVF